MANTYIFITADGGDSSQDRTVGLSRAIYLQSMANNTAIPEYHTLYTVGFAESQATPGLWFMAGNMADRVPIHNGSNVSAFVNLYKSSISGATKADIQQKMTNAKNRVSPYDDGRIPIGDLLPPESEVPRFDYQYMVDNGHIVEDVI